MARERITISFGPGWVYGADETVRRALGFWSQAALFDGGILVRVICTFLLLEVM